MANNIIKLIRKDFYALMSEKIMGILFISLLMMSAFFASYLNFSSVIFLFLCVYSYIQNVFSLDEKYRTEKYYASLPVRRSEIVIARYGGVVAIAGIYILVAYLANVVFRFFNITEVQSIPADYCISVFLILSFLTSFTYPFYFRFGITRAKAVSVLLFIIIGGSIGTMMSLARSKGAGLTTQSIFLFSQEIITSIFLVGIAAIFLGVSVPLTLALYSKKDL